MAELPTQLDASMFADDTYASAFAIFQRAYEKSEKVGLAYLQQALVSQNGGMPASFIEKKLRDTMLTGYTTNTAKADAETIIREYKSRRLNDVLNRIEVTPDNLSAAMDYLTGEIDALNDRGNLRTGLLKVDLRFPVQPCEIAC